MTTQHLETLRNAKVLPPDYEPVFFRIAEQLIEKYSAYFENSPMILRKINLILDDTNMSLSIFNHKHEENYDENYFKLINPTFFDQ